MYPGSYYSHTNPMPYYYYSAPNDNDPKLKDQQCHMKMDHNHIPLSSPYQPWPYAPNYPATPDYHGCCNPTYFYGGPYGFQPPYPNYQLPPPPPSLNGHGFYPFPGVYSIPPPVEQPKYDHDKNNHCCGCKHQEHEKKPSIEGENQQVDKKTSESLVPYLLKDCPYPIMWVPPGYMNTGSKTMVNDNPSDESVSLKTLEPVKGVENREIDGDLDNGEGERFPFQLFWLPSEEKKSGNEMKERNVDFVARNGLTDEKKEQTRINDETESDKSGKHIVQKVIPVKQVGSEEEKKIPKRVETKPKSDSVEQSECKSSPKSSKLPPVCLRIDPLPRKKKTSRSPSPPGVKERSKDSSINDPKSSQQESKKKLEDEKNGNIKTIEVTNTVEKDSLCDRSDNELATKRDEICQVKERKKLSEHEAALIIQSVYRGFEVRKSQPLMKLHQISEVKKQVVELRNRIQDLETSFATSVDEKQKLVIGETIMSILLKLDTIQGLHPIVRDVRKSVAKDLVGLQEKLDSLTFVKPEAPIEENFSSAEQVVHTKDDDDVQKKSDHGQSQSQLNNDFKVTESDLIRCEHHEVEVTDHQGNDDADASDTNSEQPVNEAVQDKFDRALNESDSVNGVESTDFVDNGGTVEAHDTKFVEHNNGELNNEQFNMFGQPHQPVDDVMQDKSDSNVETVDSGSDICANHEVESADFKDDVGTEPVINLEPLVELESQPSFVEVSNSQLENLEDGPDHTDENVDLCNDPAVETMESRDNSNVEDHDRDAIIVETKADISNAAIQEDFVVSTEEAPKVDDGDSCTEIVMEDIGRVPSVVTSGDDKRLMEENEKLRVAMEELMKAGNQQLNVIKELTGRVNDLEKKLSRNKKKIKLNNKCGRSRGRCVIREEIRDCSV